MTDDRSVRGQVGELVRDGVVVAGQRLDPDRCARLAATARKLVAADLPPVERGGTGSGQGERDRTGSDHEGADRVDPEPGAAIRGDPDGRGTVEVVHAHRADEAFDDLRDELFLEGIVNGCTETFYRADSISVRVHRGPTDPEPYHVAGEDLFLGVVYLTDCTEVEAGPYAYIHGSQNESVLKRRAGSVLSSITDRGTGEAGFYEAADGTAHTGPAGTAIVANGRGYGRFLPVEAGRESVVALIAFRPAAGETLDGSDGDR